MSRQLRLAKQSAEAANAQTGLTVRDMVDDITALNNGMQREQVAGRVKLDFTEQQAVANTRFIDQTQSFDAMMARHDERLKASEQLIREPATRRPQ